MKVSLKHSLLNIIAALAFAGFALTGCTGAKEKPKVEPRVVIATFEGQSIDQVRTALMLACTNAKWTIRSKTGEVSCHNNKLQSRRYDVIEAMVNDPVGQRYSENIQFELSQDGTKVTAKGRAWIQYMVAGGFFTSSTLKTMDLDDDVAIDQIRKLLIDAKGKVQ